MKKILYALGIMLLTVSCDDSSLTDLNVDVKNPSVVPPSTLFTNAEKNLTEQLVNTNVNRNIFRLVNQQWTETTYLDESNYNWVTRKISDNHWDRLYAGPLADLSQAKGFLEKDVISPTDPEFAQKTIIKKNQLILIDILMVYTYQILVDTFGDVPYSESLKGSEDYLPKYDKAVDIYKDLIVRLNKDITGLDTSKPAFGSAEVIYKDNLTAWIKFANSIKLKLGINLKSSGLESAIADAAIISGAAGGFSSNADNAKLPYMLNLPNTNPLYVDMVFSGRNDFVVAKPFVDKLVALNDPRKTPYFRPTYKDTNAAGDLITVTGYRGGIVGIKNSQSRYTHASDKIKAPDFSGTLLDYAEVQFLLAEAVGRGVAVGGTIASHYNAAILASMEDWGVSPADANAYLAQPAVAYATATGTWQQKVGEQAWYALFNRGFEGWTSTRRLDFPVLTAPASADAAAEGKVPSRMAYPIREQTLNATNYTAASTSIGGDKLSTKIFWDK
ncbi:SusD/RagB family nutrient-binding outer membrane lipoprotein [Flavobacterium lipolyticum]|uniref:SusD/RagB family nutrient-binding outer membrane lipoprotein n=1 Tax=Flavobacterium lipolyticum TaxID=2893754 RepID=A0ABS8LXB7_9FLAO|nr:SusD/RagB family nutrient-binding outer membrane lipoprotein [Flavobacterium sp. F-126]MCC9017216.1 SusD/RagB family nutrient-binding outer membrane lipoprotein [Flavobacterium sp. F-126]